MIKAKAVMSAERFGLRPSGFIRHCIEDAAFHYRVGAVAWTNLSRDRRF
jgi:hypothetical protein